MNQQTINENPMREVLLEKVVLSCGATGQNLDKSRILLEMLSGKKVQTVHSGPQRRIPNFGVKPNMPLGVMVTIRGKEAEKLLVRLLGAVNNSVSIKKIAENAFSFGIQEYIEIPGIEYQREIGIRGLSVTVVFKRRGVGVKRRKIKRSKLPKKQNISKEEIIEFMRTKFSTSIK